jgi:hypothetical protein
MGIVPLIFDRIILAGCSFDPWLDYVDGIAPLTFTRMTLIGIVFLLPAVGLH